MMATTTSNSTSVSPCCFFMTIGFVAQTMLGAMRPLLTTNGLP